MKYSPFCLSSFLAFRYVVREGCPWKPGVVSSLPDNPQGQLRGVGSTGQILAVVEELMRPLQTRQDIGILLSGGIDSAVLARFMPAGSPAYTIRFVADNAVDETPQATRYAEACGLRHHIIDVTWADYERHVDALMMRKHSPLHAVEVGLYKAGLRASADGLKALVLGNGADSTFGGLDKLLSRDWKFDEFVDRYTFVKPSMALVEPVDIRPVYEAYRRADGLDVSAFLKVVHGNGVIQAFDNAIRAAGCQSFEPYECMRLTEPLDLERIRRGESKYLLRAAFSDLYPSLSIPEKIAFARPMDQWLGQWRGPLRPEFVSAIPWDRLTGDQLWLLYGLNRFLNLCDTIR